MTGDRDLAAESALPGWRVLSVPLPVWAAVLSCLAMVLGWDWDIQGHRCIGRDTVWTPPHISIYVALVLALLYNAWLVLCFTFGRARRSPAIRVLGFRGPSGAFVTLWGWRARRRRARRPRRT